MYFNQILFYKLNKLAKYIETLYNSFKELFFKYSLIRREKRGKIYDKRAATGGSRQI